MLRINGPAMRALVDVLPPHAFDALIEELPELLDGLEASKVRQFIHWEPLDESNTLDDVADAYGYDDADALMYEGPYCLVLDDGVIIIE